MAKVTFIGNGRSDPESTELFGHTFPLGRAVEVTDEQALTKLANNSHFRVGEASTEGAPDFRKMTKAEISEWCSEHGTDIDSTLTKDEMIELAEGLAG